MDNDEQPKDFIRQRIQSDIAASRNGGRVVTRFPPEPNGYLHIGHAKSISLNFDLANEFGGQCFLRFDDTNPVKEDPEFVEAIQRDIRWLGYSWDDRLTHASDYFSKLHELAVTLIKDGKAYVDSSSVDDIRARRGTLTQPGENSPFRDRAVDENLALFQAMGRGEFAEGEQVLRAKIDMAAPNMNLRDPVLYRIRKVPHQRTGDRWCIYPMYDFAHTLSDALEGTTHSICTLEFEDHRPLYEWFLENLTLPHHPQQIEFSRLNLMFTVTSKRKLKTLIDEGVVTGWDDPRMPTLAAMRRRGYPPAAILELCRRSGVTKKEHFVELGALETFVRDELNEHCERRMAVLKPLRVILENYPEDQTESLPAANHPNRPELGERALPFSREIFIDREDFMEDPPRKFFRLKPGGEVRLRYAYIIKCEEVLKDEAGEIVALRCSYDPHTRSGMPEAGRKVKGTIHWVSAQDHLQAEVRLYDRLFSKPYPEADVEDFHENLNPDSLQIISEAMLEPSLASAVHGQTFQFERQGYFCVDAKDSRSGAPVFNRTVTLRDSWAKVEREAASAQKKS
jgi:glutaminyl-tRNA synthetase